MERSEAVVESSTCGRGSGDCGWGDSVFAHGVVWGKDAVETVSLWW